MSQTPPPPPQDPPQDQAEAQAGTQTRAPTAPYATPSRPQPQMGVGMEVWLCGGIGVILMLLSRSFAIYLITVLTGQTYNTNVTWTSGPNAGQPVGYWELSGYTGFSDMAIFIFGLAMVVEAIMLATLASRPAAGRIAVTAALVMSVLATGLNVIVAMLIFSTNILPILSLLAVLFGVYMAVYQWRLLQMLGATRR